MRGNWAMVCVGLALLTVGLPARAAEGEERGPRAVLGITAESTGADAKRAGAIVRVVHLGGPAAEGGIKQGDVIVHVGDKSVEGYDELAGIIRDHKPGDKVSILVLRDGEERKLAVTLGPRFAKGGRESDGDKRERDGDKRDGDKRDGDKRDGDKRAGFLGVHTKDADGGVAVTEVLADTPAAKAGLKEDDVISEVDGKEVKNAVEFRAAIQKAGSGTEVTLDGTRGKKDLHVHVTLASVPREYAVDADGFAPKSVRGDPQSRIREMERKIEEMEKIIKELRKQLEEKK